MSKGCTHILLTLFSILVIGTKIYGQQRAQFTQYMFNNALINPAYAGADEALSLTFLQRNQWSGVENAPSTQTLTGHTLFKKRNVGLGILLSNDKLGVHKNINALTQYAYHLQVGAKSYLSAGLQAGIVSRRSDYSSLLGNSSPDPKLAGSTIQHSFFDMGTGLYFRSDKLHVGLSVPQLLAEQLTVKDSVVLKFSKANYFLFLKYRTPINDNTEIEPSLLFKYLAGVPMSFDINLNFIYRKAITMGLSYRKNESFDFLLKGQITPQMQFGYAYDYPIGRITRLTNGSHEFMIQYVFRYVQKNVTSPR
jgi:type IX secretion system PorP/SprF family membrane protein